MTRGMLFPNVARSLNHSPVELLAERWPPPFDRAYCIKGKQGGLYPRFQWIEAAPPQLRNPIVTSLYCAHHL